MTDSIYNAITSSYLSKVQQRYLRNAVEAVSYYEDFKNAAKAGTRERHDMNTLHSSLNLPTGAETMQAKHDAILDHFATELLNQGV